MNIIDVNLQFRNLSYGNNPQMIILHHAEARQCSIQDIHQWHLENGWAGCGYHFLVRKDGSIYKGRPIEAIGSHCKGKNSVSIGICAEGDYMTESMPAAQKNSIIELIKYLRNQYGELPILGHAESMNFETSCPGTNYPLSDIVNGNIEKEEIHYIVCYNNDIDKRAALYLSEYLGCDCIDDRTTPFNYEGYYPICVGGGGFTSYMKLNLKGEDRFKTMLAVAQYIEGRR